jgi:gliding motility-associated lipoprotein GldB
MRILLCFVLGWFLLAGCGDKGERCAFIPETSAIKVNVRYKSLEDSLPGITTKSELVHFLGQHPDIRDHFFSRANYPSDSAFINDLFARFTNPHLDTLLMETHRVFADGSDLKKEFENAFANVRYYYPAFKPPAVQTVISGMENDLLATDSLLVIGLDYFLGNGAKYRPNMYQYMLRRYDKHFVVPSVILLIGIDVRFNKIDPADHTVLADMIAYGKAYYFTKQMLPCTPDSVLIGYSAQEMEGSKKFENLIWSRLVEDEVLYSTNHLVKQRYIGERPKTLEVGEQCPGRIGMWVGWQIVKRYMENHPDTKLQDLMNMQNASQLFKDSGYKPQVVKVPSSGKV